MHRLTPDRYELVARALRYLAWVELTVGGLIAAGVVADAEPWRRGFQLLFAVVVIPTVWAALLASSYIIELLCETLDEIRDRG